MSEEMKNDLSTLPHIEVMTVHNNIVRSCNLNEYNVKDLVVLYFYPKDATPGCTVQANDFTHLYNEFAKYGVTIIGVSRDTVKAHEKFIEKQSITFELIADPKQILCQYYDVIKPKNMYGKIVTGIQRSTFLYQKGTLLETWRKVSPNGHAKIVLDYIAAI